jgi:general secretion pathway protein K
VTALLAVLMITFAGDARTELELARNQYESAKAQAIADSGVTFAVLGVLQGGDAPWRVDGERHSLAYGGGRLEVSAQDEGGKIDLNLAPPELLDGLFTSLGLPAEQATALTQALRAWEGAGPGTPIAPDDGTGDSEGPTRRRFLSIEELRQVPGVSRELYERIAPYVTIYSRIPRIDPLSASEIVLRAIPGIDAAKAQAYVEARTQGTPAGTLPELGATGGYLAHMALRAFTVTSAGETASGRRYVREAVVAMTSLRAVSFRYLAWRQRRE